MKRKKKVGLLIPHLQSGGAERVISNISNILSDEDYEVYIFLFDTTNISYKYSGKLINLNSKSNSFIIFKILNRILRILKLSFYKIVLDLDLVISFLYSANVVNYYSFGRSRKIIACRGYSDFIKNGEKYSKMYNKIDSIIIQTERMKDEFIEKYNLNPSKIIVLNNPFDFNDIILKSKFEVEKNIENFYQNHLVILTVGSFKKDKGYWHLIKAFKLLKDKIPNVGLIFVGHRGEMEKDIVKLVHDYELNDSVKFLGFTDNPFKYISRCKLYVCSSLNEGFPNALVEAMACGVPVISTDCLTGPMEILNENIINLEDSIYTKAKFGLLVKKFEDEIDLNIRSFTTKELEFSIALFDILKNETLLNDYKLKSLKGIQRYSLDNFRKKIIEIVNK